MKKTLIVIDIQNEYIMEGRPFYIENINQSLKNAKKILSFAREQAWNIIHVKHEQEGDLFEKNNYKTEFINGFEALENEYVISKSNYSCFSSKIFSTLIEENKDNEYIIIGYSSALCCLSTIIEGYHKGLNIKYITDASMAKSNKYNEIETHAHVVETLSAYSKNIKTSEILNQESISTTI